MRSFMVAMTVLVAIFLAGSRAEARYGWYPWCAWLTDGLPGGGCVFDSLSECWATVRGVGGYCGINPYPAPPTSQRRRAPRRANYR